MLNTLNSKIWIVRYFYFELKLFLWYRYHFQYHFFCTFSSKIFGMPSNKSGRKHSMLMIMSPHHITIKLKFKVIYLVFLLSRREFETTSGNNLMLSYFYVLFFIFCFCTHCELFNNECDAHKLCKSTLMLCRVTFSLILNCLFW